MLSNEEARIHFLKCWAMEREEATNRHQRKYIDDMRLKFIRLFHIAKGDNPEDVDKLCCDLRLILRDLDKKYYDE
jgi:hypothetical protein